MPSALGAPPRGLRPSTYIIVLWTKQFPEPMSSGVDPGYAPQPNFVMTKAIKEGQLTVTAP